MLATSHQRATIANRHENLQKKTYAHKIVCKTYVDKLHNTTYTRYIAEVMKVQVVCSIE